MIPSLPASFDNIFENGPAAYIIVGNNSPTFTILNVNQAYLKLTHTQKHAIIGRGMFEIFPGNPEEISGGSDLLKDSLIKVIASKESQKMPMHRYDLFDPATNEYVKKYWTGINTPLLDEKGDVSCIIHSPLDVTYTYELSRKEKETVRALHQQRNGLFAVFKYAPVGIGIFKGRELFVELANNELCYLLGLQQKEIIGKSMYEIMQRVGGDDFLEIIRNSLNSNNPFVGYELPLKVVRNGSLKDVYINFAYEKIDDTEEDQTSIIVVATDVSTQVSTRKQLEESEQRLNMAVTASNMGVWDTNLITKESIRSDRHAQIFGYPDNSSEWSLDIMFSHVHPEDIERLKREHAKAQESGVFNVQVRINALDNKEKWIHVMGQVQRDARGNAVRMLGTVSDITGSKELEKLKDEFISTVSHEIKTPVTSIKAYGQILQRKMREEDNLENVVFLKKIDVQINRLTDLVHHFLDATRIDNNKLNFEPVSFNLNELAMEIVDEIQQISPNHRLHFSPGTPLLVYADTERIRQVIVNMLNNALKYSPNADRVDIFTYEKDNFACLCVKDYGIGIPPSQQGKIFNRFYQADDRANAAPGLGLGLYISYEIINRQQGEMWVESGAGEGSSFYFKLPLRISE